MDYNMPKFSLKRWEQIVEAFYEKYSALKRWQDENYKLVIRQGFLVNPTGRILTFHKHQKENGGVMYNKAEVCNYPVQSLATADIVPLAMVVISRRIQKEGLSNEVKLINQVHDSIILDLPKKYLDTVAKICYNTFQELPKLITQYFGFEFNVPLTGEIKYGELNWNELTKWEPTN
jgi:DNA polymerase I-like protein with 3'-5' exonuclease and polymerase domains